MSNKAAIEGLEKAAAYLKLLALAGNTKAQFELADCQERIEALKLEDYDAQRRIYHIALEVAANLKRQGRQVPDHTQAVIDALSAIFDSDVAINNKRLRTK